jgi:hypothetical protein
MVVVRSHNLQMWALCAGELSASFFVRFSTHVRATLNLQLCRASAGMELGRCFVDGTPAWLICPGWLEFFQNLTFSSTEVVIYHSESVLGIGCRHFLHLLFQKNSFARMQWWHRAKDEENINSFIHIPGIMCRCCTLRYVHLEGKVCAHGTVYRMVTIGHKHWALSLIVDGISEQEILS